MEKVHCANCHKLLPLSARYCAYCGELMTTEGDTIPILESDEAPTVVFSDDQPTLIDADALTLARSEVQASDNETTLTDNTLITNTPSDELKVDSDEALLYEIDTPRNGKSAGPALVGRNRVRSSIATTPLLQDQWSYFTGNKIEDPTQQVTWYKEVELHTDRPPAIYPPRPSPSGPIPLIGPKSPHYISPRLFFWGSLIVVIMLVFGGVFGILATSGRGLKNPVNRSGDLSLQVSPNMVTIGGVITLRGSNFSSGGRVGLTRDTSIPIADTNNSVVANIDNQGNFTDTVLITDDWGDGPHTVSAEDAITHKIASFPVVVTGQNHSLRPAHLQISSSMLDFGQEDQATNSVKTVALTNLGSGQISWKASSDQPWLQVSPQSGIVNNTVQVTIAANRTGLAAGPYSGTIQFTSNAGSAAVQVNMQVTQLPPTPQQAILQISPATLTFSAADGGPSPADQAVTISNPGSQTLNWNASTDSSWLSVSANAGSINASGNSTALVHVNSGSLLPNTYTGHITISGQGGSQSITVNLTVTPPCSLQPAPTMLSFTQTYLQATSNTRSINLGVSDGCSSSIHWNASSSENWLTIDATNGKTPGTINVGINPAGLTPGSYHGTITLNSSTGTQTVPVDLTLAPATTPAISVSPANILFEGIAGQTNQASTQNLKISNTGGGALKWRAVANTSVGGSWLTLGTSNGVITGKQTATLNVTATPLNGLTPGTYPGTITITGIDNAGNAAPGSPQSIPVTFVIKGACTISVPTALNFIGGVSQAVPAAQKIAIAASGSCSNALNWTTKISTADGASWLSVTPASGSATPANAGTASVSVNPSGLAPGVYHGSITIAATDSTNGTPVGAQQTIDVTLTVQAACGLQAPSTNEINFTAETGSNPASQTFTVGVNSSCTGNVTITPNLTLNEGQGWLSISPSSATASAGNQATFTVTAKATGLASGKYTGVIALAATNGNTASAHSPQNIGVTLNLGAPPTLSVSPGSLTVPITTGTTSSAVNITNTGGTPLNWTATLASGTPSFVTLSSSTGNGLGGGKTTTINVNINATGLKGGQTFKVTLLIKATDPLTGQPAANSPVQVPITINVASPSMQLSASQLTFSGAAGGNNPGDQAIVLTNNGGDGLSWSISPDLPSAITQPGGALPLTNSQGSSTQQPLVAQGPGSTTTMLGAQQTNSWLHVSPLQATLASGASSTLTFSVNTAGLTAGTYTLVEIVTPSAGGPFRVTITLKLTQAVTPTPGVTPTPTATATPIKQPAVTPKPQPTATPTPAATPVQTSPAKPSAAPDPPPKATPDPPPKATPDPLPKATPTPVPTPALTPVATKKPHGKSSLIGTDTLP